MSEREEIERILTDTFDKWTIMDDDKRIVIVDVPKIAEILVQNSVEPVAHIKALLREYGKVTEKKEERQAYSHILLIKDDLRLSGDDGSRDEAHRNALEELKKEGVLAVEFYGGYEPKLLPLGRKGGESR